MGIYETKRLTKEMRTVDLSKSNSFSDCEYCGSNYKDINKHSVYIKYCHQYGLVLCERCIDKINYDNEYWDYDFSKKNGLTDYPSKPKPKYIIENSLELKHRKGKKYGEQMTDEDFVDKLKIENLSRE